jgi:adenylate cyclase
VRDQAVGRVPFEFEGLGPQRMKNIAEPVETWRIRWEGEPAASPPAAAPSPAAPATDSRPGVAVLPFANMSDDKEQEYFSDGLTEDLITDLSHFSQLRVIARNSTFRYKGQAVDIPRVGTELGVRYVLEGSVRRAGEQVRITAQLIDAETQGHVWAQRYDRPQQQVFAVQDELTRAIVSAIVGNVLESDVKAAAVKAPHSLNAYELTLLGRRYLRVASSDDNIVKAHDAFEQAIAADPGYADAYRGLSRVFLSQAFLLYEWKGREQVGRDAALIKAEGLSRKAIELNARSELSYAALGEVLLFQRRYDEAIAAMEQGVALNPNNPEVHVVLGLGYRCAGRHQDALKQHEEALHLDPFPSPFVLAMGAWTLFMLKQYDLARETAERAAALSPRWRVPYNILAATYAELEDLPKARAAMEKVLELAPGFNLVEMERTSTLRRPEDKERWSRAQRLAGLPG